MSLTLEEREQWKLEINRLNAQGWAEEKKRQVEAVQAANPGMSFETAWNKVERGLDNPPPEPTTIGEAANLVKSENPTWTFERSWRHAEAVYPALVRSSMSGNSPDLASHQSYLQVEARAQKLIYESGGTMPMSEALNRARGDVVNSSLKMQDPRIAQELGKHKKLDDSRKSDAIDGHLDRMVKIRKLMTEKNLTFDAAFTQICQQESGAKTAPITASVLGHVAPPAEPKTYLVSAIESGREIDFGEDE